MTRRAAARTGLAVLVLAAGCGGRAAPGPAAAPAPVAPVAGASGPAASATPPAAAAAAADSLQQALAAAAADSAADQEVLDSLDRGLSDTTAANATGGSAPAQADVQSEAEQLFGAKPDPSAPTFDIDVSSYSANRRVLEYLDFFQTDARDRFAIWLSRLARYEGMIRERLRAKGLPEDLVYLTLIESGLSNSAVSRARAVGMWQFMAGTARLYGLEVDPWVDERRDPFKATDAAAAYLADLVQRLGSVYLAAAAYNAGAGRIERGVERLPGDVDSLTDETFFQLASSSRYLRRETRDYVPKLIAASLIAKQPERYGFTDIAPLPPLVFDEITVPDATGLDVIARLADTTTAAILELNPEYVRGITPPGRESVVRVPRGMGRTVALRFDALPATERITFVDHYVGAGQTLSGIALRYHVTVAMIRSANPRLRPSALHIGQRIVIPMSGRIVPRSAWSVPPEPRRSRGRRRADAPGTHRVRAGETASAIARRYGVTLAALLDYNDLAMASVLHPGDLLRIPPRR